jgi:hypothetical protein
MVEMDRKRFFGRALWVVNLLTLFGLCAWIAWDGQFSDSASMFRAKLIRQFGDGTIPGLPVPQLTARLLGLGLVGVLALGSAIGIFVSLFLGSRAHRRVRSWLAFTVLVSAWLTLSVTWRELAWQSQIVRLKWNLTGFEAVAESLRTDWPAADGERMDIGPFMAYPHGSPRVLLLLSPPTIVQSTVTISAIEHSASGGLRFQLTGNESGAWLEWHPSGSVPESFVGGLMTDYHLERSAPLATDWFLVRYRNTALRDVKFESGAAEISVPSLPRRDLPP